MRSIIYSRLAWRTVWPLIIWVKCDCRRVGVISATGGRCDACGRRDRDTEGAR